MKNYLDEEITRLDNEIADINTAKLRAKELGIRPGDYDLSTAAASAAEERKSKTPSSIAPKVQYEERDFIPNKELPYTPEEYEKTLSEYKGYQSKLSDALLKKHPEVKESYEKAASSGMKDRDSVISSLEIDPYLEATEQKKILGDDYQKFLDARNLLTKVDKQKYGSVTAGEKEVSGEEERYGLRNALLYNYTGPERTEEDRLADVEYLKTKQEVR